MEDYLTSAEGPLPVLMSKKAIEFYVKEGILVARDGGPWGATHCSPIYAGHWVMEIPKIPEE